MSRVEHVDRVERVSYNPDVLSCLANLSNDEVFTPPAVVNQMLDLLPQKLFASPKTKFLDPATKSGVFLREITKRLIKGLENEIPDLRARVDHILQNQVFGIATTELTSLVSRRSLYCSKYPNCKYSVSKFDTVEGNIRFRALKHTFVNGRCKWCGASASQFDRDASLESHAYEFIHTSNPEEIFNMKFDVIISNPPYQMNVGVEKENYAIPMYHRFVQQAKNLNPRFLIMIIPARWYAGGRGLDEFRDEMLHDNQLRVIHDFPDAADCFPGVQIKAGVCYFLWQNGYHGECEITTHLNNSVYGPLTRPLLEEGSSTFIRYNQAISIVRKVRTDKVHSFSKLVSPQTPFGIVTSYKGTAKRMHESDWPMYISGNDKAFKGGKSFAPDEKILKGREMIPWHKVYIGEAGSGSDTFPHTILGQPFYGEPGSICNQSYLVIGPFKSRPECENVISYIKTRFFRFMVLQKKNAQHAMRGVYQFVPLQDFSKPWTDEELYKKYNLTKDEIAFIESMIKPME